jgi:hypothetical protein
MGVGPEGRAAQGLLQQDGWLTGERPDRLVRGKAWPFPWWHWSAFLAVGAWQACSCLPDTRSCCAERSFWSGAPPFYG